MKAIFNRNCVLVGWYEIQNKNVFSKEMQWIGFINGTFVDKKGKPVAWIEGSTPLGVSVLMQPLTPLRPLRPLTPLGGWSVLDWNEYIKS